MSNTLVCLIMDDDGNDLTIDQDGNPTPKVWHLSWPDGGGDMVFCTGEFYGYGEGNARGEEKRVSRGGITCEDCRKQIMDIKGVKL